MYDICISIYVSICVYLYTISYMYIYIDIYLSIYVYKYMCIHVYKNTAILKPCPERPRFWDAGASARTGGGLQRPLGTK